MSFSFRSMFQAHPSSRQDADSSMPGNLQSAFSTPAQNPPSNMAAIAPPLNAATPFGAPLFKLAQEESVHATPLQQSPFSVSPSSSTSVPLTVADILPLLPPQIARHGALPMGQPVAVSPQVLNEALRGGQAALPIFEIYRICPALFQTPISPQDPRVIPLPTSKLPYLIAATTQATTPTAQPSKKDSPFAMLAPGQEAPAAALASTPSGMMLPPRRQGPPPPLAHVLSRETAAPQLLLPGQSTVDASAFSMSPTAAGESQTNAPTYASKGLPLTASSFGLNQPPAPTASTFGQAIAPSSAHSLHQEPRAAATVSPFTKVPQAAPIQSPFGQAPASANPIQSPLGSLFGAKAAPTGEPAPDVAPTRSAKPLPNVLAPSTNAALIRICLSNLLKGYTSAELGFDPSVVPSWITTALPSAKIQELASSQLPVAELGLLIDGITDIGFRNVLDKAKRDFRLRILREDLQTAMSGVSVPQHLPNQPSLGAAPILSQIMRQEEPLNTTPSSLMASPAVALADLSIPGTNSPFLAPPTQQADAHPNFQASAFTPSFGTAMPRSAIQPSDFGMPEATIQPLPSKTIASFAKSASEQTKPLFTFQPQQPTEQASFESQKLETSATIKSSEQEPQISLLQPLLSKSNQPQVFKTPQAFLTEPEECSQPTALQPADSYPITETTVTVPESQQESASAHSSFALMKSSNLMEEGFTSDQLLGGKPNLEQSWRAADVVAASGPTDQLRLLKLASINHQELIFPKKRRQGLLLLNLD